MKRVLLITMLFALTSALPAADGDEAKPFVLKTILGETYRNCHVLKLTPATLTVAHDTGVTKVPFTMLDDEWKKFFHYDPDKAREFEKQEAKQLQQREAKAKALNSQREKQESRQMAELAQIEKEEMSELAKREKEQAAAAAKLAASGTNAPLPPLAPLPGDPKTQGVVTTTEVVVPPVTPIGTPYTPGVNRSQTYVYPNSPGFFVVPGNGGIFVTPGQGSGAYCPPGNRRGGASGQISVGPTVIRVGP